MRIVHVITLLELGGAQQNTLHTCRRLAEIGHDVTLVSGRGGQLDAVAASAPHRHVLLDSIVRPVSPWRDLCAVWELRRLLRQLRPDVVHTHSSKAGVVGRVAAWLAGVPAVVHTVHGWSFSPNHSLATRVAYQAIESLLRPLTDHFISVSREDIGNGPGAWIAASDRRSVIRSGIDIDRFATNSGGRERVRSEWGVGPSEVLVVNASCFKPQKAPLDFVRAAGLAARDEPTLRFALVGDGELRGAIQALADGLGLGHRLLLPGWRTDMPDVLQAADVLALTSLWEGLPRTVVQARAAGRPVVATAVNGTPEAIQDGVHGMLLPPRDVQGFASAFVLLARDPGLRARLGSAGRAGLEEFDQEEMVQRQVALYESLS